MRRLLRVVNREALLGRRPVRNLAARLQCYAGVASELKRGFQHMVGASERCVHATRVQAAGKAQVIAQLRVDQGRGRVQRSFDIHHRRQHVPLHLQVLQCVFRLRAGLGHQRHHRLTLPMGTAHGQRVLRRGFHIGQVAQCGNPGLANFGEIWPVGNHQHAGHAAGKVCVDAGDAAVRHRAAPVHHVRHAGQLNVVYITPLPLHQAPRTGALRAVPDVTRVCRQVMQRRWL